eukprot:796286-Prymnesium_polylepis.1
MHGLTPTASSTTHPAPSSLLICVARRLRRRLASLGRCAHCTYGDSAGVRGRGCCDCWRRVFLWLESERNVKEMVHPREGGPVHSWEY